MGHYTTDIDSLGLVTTSHIQESLQGTHNLLIQQLILYDL